MLVCPASAGGQERASRGCQLQSSSPAAPSGQGQRLRKNAEEMKIQGQGREREQVKMVIPSQRDLVIDNHRALPDSSAEIGTLCGVVRREVSYGFGRIEERTQCQHRYWGKAGGAVQGHGHFMLSYHVSHSGQVSAKLSDLDHVHLEVLFPLGTHSDTETTAI